MANKIFVNGREVACKAGSGSSTAAFPDACFSPPVPPPTGAPIPYPVTAFASDTTDGTKHVKITDKEVMIKDKSCFKKCTGDEAATQGLAKGVVTHALSAKVYFNSWSMDVKFEDENADRHLDMTTHNHMSKPGDTPPWPFMESMKIGSGDPCEAEKLREKAACEDKGYKPTGDKDPCPPHNPPERPAFSKCKTLTDFVKKQLTTHINPKTMKLIVKDSILKDTAVNIKEKYKADPEYQKYRQKSKQYYYDKSVAVDANDCARARRCKLSAYDADKAPDGDGCCPGQTPHHLVEASSVFTRGRSLKDAVSKAQKAADVAVAAAAAATGDAALAAKAAEATAKVGQAGYFDKSYNPPEGKAYDANKAPCICVEGPNSYHGTHGLIHTAQTVKNQARAAASKDVPPSRTYAEARDDAAAAVKATLPQANCSEACIKAQLDKYHIKDAGMDEKTKLKTTEGGHASSKNMEGKARSPEAIQKSIDEQAKLLAQRNQDVAAAMQKAAGAGKVPAIGPFK